MLILVGVTINVALNGGLFTQAQTAVKETQKEAEREQLLSATVTAYDTKTGSISKSKLETNLGTGWNVDGTDGGPYTVTSPNENVFIVNADGTITDGTTGEGGTGGTGEPEQPTEPWIDNGDETYTKGDQTVEMGQTLTNEEVLENLGITESTGTYTNAWAVIGVEGGRLKLMSTAKVGTYTLGHGDPAAKIAKPAVDENNVTDTEKLNRAAWSYAHMEDTLATFAKEKTGINTARSIKLADIFELAEETVSTNGTTYRYYCDNTTGGYIYCSTEKDEEGNWLTGENTNKQRFTYTDNNKNVVTFGTLENGTIVNGDIVQIDTTFGYKSWSVSSHPNLSCFANFSGMTITTGNAAIVENNYCEFRYFGFSGTSSNFGITHTHDDGYNSDGWSSATEFDICAVIFI